MINSILKKYPERHEYKTVKDKATGESKVYEITSEYYVTRGENKQILRNLLYVEI